MGKISATTNGTVYAGGLLGYNSYATVADSYELGEVKVDTAKVAYVGGLVGHNYTNGKITNTYAVGQVSIGTAETEKIGGLVGYNNGTITSSYWSPETTKQETSGAGTPKQLQSMLQQETFTDWVFDGENAVWEIEEGRTLPYLKNMDKPTEINNYTHKIYNEGKGTEENPYIITNEVQLQAMKNEPSAHYKLGNSIVLNPGNNFEPIGVDSTYPFSGTLDGNSKTITGLNIESNNKYVGMFGYVKNGTIKDLILKDASIISTYTQIASNGSNEGYIGGIAGAITGTSTTNVATIENVSIIGESKVATSEISEGTAVANTVYIGGIVGYSYNYANIINTNSNAKIKANATTGVINAGGLVGYNYGAISASYATAGVTANTTSGAIYVGGLVGNNRATINTSYSTGDIHATNTSNAQMNVGGLVGYSNSTISDTYSTSKLFVNSTNGIIYVGGLTGQVSGTIKNSYAVGKIEEANSTGNKYIGGFIGNGSATVTSSYWSPEATGKYISGTKGEQAKLLYAMLYKNTFTDWDFDNIWGIVEGETLPYLKNIEIPEEVNKYKYSYTEYNEGTGTEDDPYIIRTEEQLQGMENGLNAHYKLGNDIQITKNFEPIGQNANYPFKGTFDGDGYKIINLDIASNNQYVGMFGYTENATIKNVTFDNANITSTLDSTNTAIYLGGVVGYAKTSTIDNILVTGKVEKIDGKYTLYIGGISGYLYASNITNSEVNINLNGETTKGEIYAGGIAGYITNSSNIENVISKGNISSNSTGNSACTGGIVGKMDGGTISKSYSIGDIKDESVSAVYVGGAIGNVNTGTISEVYSTGDVIGLSSNNTVYAGGLTGYISSRSATITDAYTTSKVTAQGNTIYAGGLSGYNYMGTIKNTYAVGKVTATPNGTTTPNVGGLTGGINNTYVTNSYWSPKATGQTTSSGGTEQEINALLYKTGYADTWDFENVWTIEEGESLAYLRGLEKPDNISENDFEYESRIEVYVKDSNGKPLKSGKYEIKNSTGTKVAEAESNSKGIAYIYDLPEKEAIYTIEEIEAPAGYKKVIGTKEFKFTEATLVVDPTTNEEITLEYVHDLIGLDLRVEDTESTGIQGVTIGLFDMDGKLIKGTDGREVKASTDRNGNVKFTKIIPGTYIYKQMTEKTGYRMNTTEYTVTIADDGTITWGEENNGIIVNEKILKNITITKTGEIKNSDEIVYLEGVEIALYNPNGTEKERKTTDREGKITFENLGVGTYSYKEVSTVEGYEINTTRYYVRINQDETIEYLNSDGKDATIHNYLTKGTIIIRKYSNSGYSLSGAVIGLYDGEEKPVIRDGKQVTATTNYQGIARFARLEPGVYKFREISAPSGYYLNSRMYTVTINDDEEYSLEYAEGDSGVIYNRRKTYSTNWHWSGSSSGSGGWHGPVNIHISWNHGGGSSGGSSGGNYRPGGSGGSSGGSSSGNKTGTIGTGGGSISIPGLAPGEYDYTITDDGTGGSESGKFVVNDDGTIDFPGGTGPSGITTDTSSIIVDVKVSGGNGNLGDKLHLYDGDGNPLYNEDGSHISAIIDESGNGTFTGLGPGKYSYPKDGDDPTDHKFTVNDDGTVTFDNEDDLPNKNLVSYKVIYYKQNDTLDGYDEFEEEVLKAREGINVAATVKEYDGYYLNKNISKETGIVQADGSLVLKMYYDIEVSTVFAIDITNVVEVDGTPIANSIFDVTVKYSNGTEKTYENKTTDRDGNIVLNFVPSKTSITKVVLKQTEVPDEIEIDSDEKYVQIKTNSQTQEIALTGSMSSDIFAKTEEGENTLYITIENSKKPEEYSDYTLKIIETDKSDSNPVAGIRNKVKQTGITDGYMQKTKDEKVTNILGEAIYEVLDKDEITFTIERIAVPDGYELIRGKKEIIVRKNASGDYELVNAVDGVTIDTENKQIIVRRQVYKIGSEFDKPKDTINNTIFITKVDEELRPLQGVTMELRASYEGALIKTWELTTDDEGMAKLTGEDIIANLGSEFPQLLMDKKGKLTFMITEKTVPLGYELLEGIGFEAYYEFDPNGELKIMYMNVLDGESYTRIVDQEYDQYEEEEYIQVDMRLKVINPYGNGLDLKTLKIEKVDGLDNKIKLTNVGFRVTLKYPTNGKLRINGITNKNGILSIPKTYFPEGTTTVEIEEKIAPNGYTTNTAKTIVDVTNTAGVLTIDGENVGENGVISVVIENNKNGGYIPYNPEDENPSINSYAIIIDKVSSTSDSLKLNGAKFNININQENGYNYVATRETYNRRGTGVYGLTGTGKIKVRLKETVAPIGYLLNGATRELVFTRDAVTKQLVLDTSLLKNIDANDITINNTNHTITIKINNTPRNYIPVISEGDDPRNPTPDPNVPGNPSNPSDPSDPSVNPGVSPSDRYNAIIIENEDIDVNSIKLEGTTFEVRKINSYLSKGITNENGLTAANIGKSGVNTVVQYTIINKEMEQKGYIKNQDVILQITYNENGTMQNAEFISAGMYATRTVSGGKVLDSKGRIVAEVDEDVNYVDKNAVKVKIRCAKSKYLPVPGGEGEWVGSTTNPDNPDDPNYPGVPSKPDNPTRPSELPSPVKPTQPIIDPENPDPDSPDAILEPDFGVLLEKVNTHNAKIKVEGAKYRINVLNEATGESTTKIETTNSLGQISFTGLLGYGNFTITITEVESPEEYTLDTNKHIIRVNRDSVSQIITLLDDENSLGNNAEVRVDNINKIIKTTIKEATSSIGLGILKLDSEDEKIALKNAEFEIIDNETKETYSLKTGLEGMGYISLPIKSEGVYTFKIKEITAPVGYKDLSTVTGKEFTLNVEYDGEGLIKYATLSGISNNIADIEKLSTDYIEISLLNEKQDNPDLDTYSIELIKGDAYYPSVTFKDAKIKIDIDHDKGIQGLTKTDLTDADGKIYINDIYGTGKVVIKITELEPPPGRRFDTKTKQVILNIHEDNNWIELDKHTSNVDTFIDNENKKVTIRIRNYPDDTFIVGANKVDAEDNDLILVGAEYKLQLLKDSGELDSRQIVSKETVNGLLTFGEIPMPSPLTGNKIYTYLITETKAPEGYLLNSTPVVLKVEVSRVNGINTITNAYIEKTEDDGSITQIPAVKFGDEYIHIKLEDIVDPETRTQITVHKVWVDTEGQRVKRPANIKIQIKNGDKVVKEEMISNTTESIDFTNLPKYDADGNEIIYTVEEVPVNPGELEYYVSSKVPDADGNYTITNTFMVPESKLQVKIRKVAEGTAVGLSGAEIKVYDGNEYEEVKETGADGYATFIGLKPNTTYTYREITPPISYTLNDNIYSFRVNEIGEIEYSVGSNGIIENEIVRGSVRITKYVTGTTTPVEGVVIGLYNESGIPLEDEEGNPIKMTTGVAGEIIFSGLTPGNYKYKEESAPIQYVKDNTMYEFTVNNDGTITFENDTKGIIYNSIKTVSVGVHKIWVDTEGQRIKRPENIVIRVKNGDEVVSTQTVSNTTGTIEFTGLPEYDSEGNKIQYTVEEIAQNEGDLKFYVSSVVVNEDGTYTITNRFTVPGDAVNVGVHKVWVDTDGQRIKRPENIVIRVKNGDNVVSTKTIPSEDTETDIEFTELPKYDENGNEIRYTVEEIAQNEGDLKFYVSRVVLNEDGTYTIINTFTVPGDTINVEVHKVWVDTVGQRIKRPENIVIRVKNGDKVVSTQTVSKTTETINFAGLPKYDENGNEIQYTVEEVAQNEGDLEYYVSTVNGHTITNTFTVPTSKLQVSIRKIDKDTKVGLSGAVIELYDAEGNKGTDTTNIYGYATFGGLKINTTYYYREIVAPTGYTLNSTEYSFRVNEIGEIEDIKVVRAENGDLVIENDKDLSIITTGKTVHKIWVDTEGQRIKRPENIVIRVKNGDKVVSTQTVSKTTETINFTGLPKYDENGNEIQYTVEEIAENTGDLKYYVSDVVLNEDGTFTITNTFRVPEDMLQVSIRKIDKDTKVGLSGAVIELYDAEGNKGTDTTNIYGYATFGGLKINTTYYYREIVAPTGYTLNSTEYSFRVNEIGEIEDIKVVRAENGDLVIENDKELVEVIRGKATIVKYITGTHTPLEGAVIGLYDEENNLTQLTTSSEGKVEFENLIPGKTYRYKEITAPIGYKLNETTYSFTVAEDGTIVFAEDSKGIIYNDPLRINVPIYKIDIVTKEILKGATIELYNSDGTAIESKETEEDGYVTFTDLIVGRTYKYKEIVAPKGYKLDDTMYEFTINADGTIIYNSYIEIDGQKYLCIYNTPEKDYVIIVKKDIITGEILSGAKIGIYDEFGNLLEQDISDEEGKVVFSGFIRGRTYYYKEITAPEGYKLNETTYSFAIAKDGTITYIGDTEGIIYNEPLRVSIPIYKIDILTKELLRGATIELYNSDGSIIEAKETGEDGYAIFNNIIVGRTYKYKEIVAPKGYKLDDTMYEFTINADGTIIYNNYIEIDGEKYLCVYDEPLRIDVPIYKVDILTKELLRGATIELYNPDGSIVEAKETGENGVAIFNNLIVGRTYRYKEIVAPLGYELNDTVYEFTVKADGTIIYNNYIEIDGEKYLCVYDEPLRIDVPIYKLDLITKELLRGAKIELYNKDGSIIEAKETGEDGIVIFNNLIVGRTYKYKEIVAPNGYKLDDTMYEFTINRDGTITYGNYIEIDGKKYAVIYDTPIKDYVIIVKKDIVTGKLLQGAVIGVYDDKGNMVQSTTDADGKVIFSGFTRGVKYKYKEITAPVGYKLNKTVYSFIINDDGTISYEGVADGIIYNEPIQLTITKKDLLTGKVLKGAVIGLYDEFGNVVQGSTLDDGTIIFGGLLAGKTYRYKEIKAPLGYVLNETIYTVRISEDGEIIYEGDTEGVIYNERIRVDVPIYKMEKGTQKLLSGAVIGLYDKDGNPVLENGEHIKVVTNAEGKAIFTGLEVGEIYQYKEEFAPIGYRLNENLATFRISEEGAIMYDSNGGIIYNEKILVQPPSISQDKLPQTGKAEINTIVLGVLMSLAGLSTMATVYYKKKIIK